MRLIAAGAGARAAWQEELAGDARAVTSQTPAWLDCLTSLGRHVDATRAYETPDGRRLVLPLARLRRLPTAVAPAASMPFGWGRGGLVSSGGAAAREDIAAVVADLGRARRLRLEVQPGPAASPEWDAVAPAGIHRTQRMTQVLDLEGGFAEVWDNHFASRVRRNTRKAERQGIEVTNDDAGRLVPVFDALYRASVTRWAERQNEPLALAQWRARRRDPKAKFAAVAERLGRDCRVWVAWRDGVPAAAIIVLTHAENSTYWRGAMDDAVARGTGANELLHRAAIEHACEAGGRQYDMGDSAPDSSLAHFKRGFGTVDHPHLALRFEGAALTAAEDAGRRAVKRVVGFRD